MNTSFRSESIDEKSPVRITDPEVTGRCKLYFMCMNYSS